MVETCGTCHSDPEIVDEYGLEGDEQEAYLGSVHAELLIEDGDLSAPQCATCHGNHGATPPGFADVGAVCGKCHIKQKDLFATSPHARLVAEGEFNTCAVCHGHHNVLPASESILERICTLCHGEGDKGIEVRNLLLGQLRAAQATYDSTSARVTEALRHGIAGEEDQVLMETARTSLLEMQAIQHSLDPELLERNAASVRNTLARVDERIEAATNLEELKRIALLPVIVFLVLMCLGFWARFKRIHESKLETA